MSHSDLDLLPAPYPGELWYSLVARALRDWGYLQRETRLRALLGSLPAKVNIAFPNRITSLLSYASHDDTRSELDFSREHTLLPYYLAFDPPQKLEDLLAMSARTDQPLGKLMGHFRPPQLPTRLRYCRSCRDEDIERIGEPYWHVAHQLPYVINCAKHGDRLFNSLVLYEPGRLDYWTAHASRCPDRELATVGPPLSHSLSRAIGEVSVRALLGPWKDRHLDAAGYASLLKTCGFGNSVGTVASRRFKSALDGFMDTHGNDLHGVHQRNWGRLLYTEVKGRLWPIQHVLMRVFIRERLWQSHIGNTASIAHLERKLVGVAV